MPDCPHINADKFGIAYQGFCLLDLLPRLSKTNTFQVGLVQLLELIFGNKIGLMPQIREAESFKPCFFSTWFR